MFINNNHELGQILWEQMVLGYPEFGVRHTAAADFAAFAEANGGLGLRVEKAADVEGAVAEALAHPGPGARRRPDQPRRAADAAEGHLRPGQGVRHGVPRGQPHKATIATTLFRDKIDELRG